MGMLKNEALSLAERLMKIDRVKNKDDALPTYFQDACRMIEVRKSHETSAYCALCDGRTIPHKRNDGVMVCKFCGERV